MRKLPDQARFSNAWLANHSHDLSAPASGEIECLGELPHFLRASDELRKATRHVGLKA
jgi:hypothetical protein